MAIVFAATGAVLFHPEGGTNWLPVYVHLDQFTAGHLRSRTQNNVEARRTVGRTGESNPVNCQRELQASPAV